VLDVQPLGIAFGAQGKGGQGAGNLECRACIHQHVVIRLLQADPPRDRDARGDGEQLDAEPAASHAIRSIGGPAGGRVGGETLLTRRLSTCTISAW
jgi:hypothetical protein